MYPQPTVSPLTLELAQTGAPLAALLTVGSALLVFGLLLLRTMIILEHP